jgi:inner membrane protein
MDNLTHTLLGVGMANAGLSRRAGGGALMTLFLASNFPDVDFLWSIVRGGDAFLERRMLTHSIAGIPLFAAALAWLMGLFYRETPWRRLFALALLGMGVHAFFDLVNSYGVVLLYPLTRARLELAWVFIIDVALWALLLAPLLLAWLPRGNLEKLSRWSLAAVALYVAFCAAGRWRSAGVLDKIADAEGLRPTYAYVFPEALGPHRFRGVLKEGSEYRMYQIRPWTGSWDARGVFPTEENEPVVRAARTSERGRRLDWFFKAPVWRLTADGKAAEASDLRFKSSVLKWDSPFVFRVEPKDNKEVGPGQGPRG